MPWQRAAAGLATHGVGEGTVVSWQLPTWIESFVLVGALARLGAVQNPILPIYREREVAFVARQAKARLLIVPSTWRGFDFRAMADEVAAEVDGARRPHRRQAAARRRPRDRCRPHRRPPTIRCAGSSTRRARRPTPRARSTPTPRSWRPPSRWTSASRSTADDRSGLVFPFTHIGGITWLFSTLLEGCTTVLVEAFDPATTPPVLQREGVTLAGSGTTFHMAYLAAQRANPAERYFAQVRAFPGGGAPKPPQLHHDLKAEMGGVGIVSGYGLTEAPIITMASVDDSDEVLARDRGPRRRAA